jgi:hypothetical protein
MTAIRAVTPADPVRPAAKPAALRALARLRTPGANLSDREFLAPALEILETPPSPVHVAFLWTICAFALAALVWAYLGHVDIVAAAQGKFQPTGRVKVVEPLETGRVEDIRVANGSLVKAGDVLIELDRASAEPEFWGEVQPPASLKGLDIPSRRTVFVPWKPSRRPAFGMGNPTFR